MGFLEKNIAMIQSKHCDELIETMRWFKSFIAMFYPVDYQLCKMLICQII